MRAAEKGFLLLTSCLGDPERKPLTTAQFRTLTSRMQAASLTYEDRDLNTEDLTGLGYDRSFALRVLHLLSQEDLLEHYLQKGQKQGCVCITRISDHYPLRLRQSLGLDSPGCIWAKGDLSCLDYAMISLVGSRQIRQENARFAREVGRQAAHQGYILVSGNARGADQEAQEACLAAGGQVVSIVADELCQKTPKEGILYLSEDSFDLPFSSARALSRNRLIHAMGCRTFVAQSSCGLGGTWDGTVKNLRFGWSPVFCYSDGSEASERLIRMGANGIVADELQDIPALMPKEMNFLTDNPLF